MQVKGRKRTEEIVAIFLLKVHIKEIVGDKLVNWLQEEVMNFWVTIMIF
jgi:hypothetical protein